MTDTELLAALQAECISCARAKAEGLLVTNGVHFIEDEADEARVFCVACPVCMPLEREARKRGYRRGYRTRGLLRRPDRPAHGGWRRYDDREPVIGGPAMTEAPSKYDFGMDSWCERFLDFVERPAPPRGRFRTVSAAVLRAALEDANSGMIAGDWSLERWEETETVEDAAFWHDVILTCMIRRHCREHYGERLLEIVVGEHA